MSTETQTADDGVSIETTSFETAKETGETLEKGGYHQPGGNPYTPHCGCVLETPKGAYRDLSVKMPDGRTIHYYHQSPVVAETASHVRISSCGWQTSTTKERINRYLPSGFRVYQRDYDWYVKTPDGDTIDFKDGMILKK